MRIIPSSRVPVNGKPGPEHIHEEINYHKSRKALENRLLLMSIKSSRWFHQMKQRICPVLHDGRTRRPDFEQADFNEIYAIVARHWETTPGSDAQDLALKAEEMELCLGQALAPPGGPGLTEERAQSIAAWLLPDIRDISIDVVIYEALPQHPHFQRWLEERACEYELRRLQPAVLGRAVRLEDFELARTAIQKAAYNGHSHLSVRSPWEILGQSHDPNDVILGDGLWSRGELLSVIGAPEVGKSRLVTQLVACCVAGRSFLNLETRCKNLRWLILQTENSNRRLQQELRRVLRFIGPEEFQRFNRQVRFHVLEHELDGVVMLGNMEALARVSKLVQETKPDCIVIDPLRDFGIGNLDKDEGMVATINTLLRVCREGDPRRSVLVVHHARTGRAAAACAVGFDKASFGRNSKALLGMVRGQINIAPAVADNARIVVACGKCSNGPQFPSFGVKMNSKLIYEVDTEFDVEAWQEEMERPLGRPRKIDPADVVELCRGGPLSKAQLLKAIQEKAGCSAKTAGRVFDLAEGKLVFDQGTKLYSIRGVGP